MRSSTSAPTEARPIGRVTPARCARTPADGQFASGSMGPKVEAAVRFVEQGGTRSVITSLQRIGDAVTATGDGPPVGTVIENT